MHKQVHMLVRTVGRNVLGAEEHSASGLQMQGRRKQRLARESRRTSSWVKPPIDLYLVPVDAKCVHSNSIEM